MVSPRLSLPAGFLLVTVLLMLVGCGAVVRHQDSAALPAGPVLVLPLENLSGHPNAGLILADALRNELRSAGVPVIDADIDTIAQRIAEGGDTDIAALAREMEAASVAVGSVHEYGYKSGLGEEPVIGVRLRVLAADGSELWSGAYADAGQHGFFRDDSLGRQTLIACRALVAALLP